MRLIIGRRLERLDESEKRALAAAAVIGRSFSFQLLTAISQVDVDELFTVIEKAQQMGISRPELRGAGEAIYLQAMNSCVRRYLPASRLPADSDCMPRSPTRSQRLNPDALNERAGDIADPSPQSGIIR